MCKLPPLQLHGNDLGGSVLKTYCTLLAVYACLSAASLAEAAGRQPVAPTGAEHDRQYLKVLANCRKNYGGGSRRDVEAHWASHYGKTGWFCTSWH